MKKKVLHIVGGMGRGGAPIFIINNLKYIDDSKLQFDFLCRKNNCAYNDIINKHGGHVFVVSSFPRHLFSNFKQTYKFFKEHAMEYEAIHIHANALYYILPLFLGKIFKVKKIIIHSHSTQSGITILKPIHYFNRLFLDLLANVYLACGKDAGRWMFGNRKFEVINNAVDVQKFNFVKYDRTKIRTEFGLTDDTFVIGNVGRFEEVKNHKFIVDVFHKYHVKNPKSVLLLVGEGSLFNEVKHQVIDLGLTDSVIFAGLRTDVEKIYAAIDLFLLPSLFEGLPFVLVEAQCSGVNCLVSDSITREAFITDLVTSLKLKDDIEVWVDALDKLSAIKKDRSLYAELIRKKKYDIRYTATRLTEIYTE